MNLTTVEGMRSEIFVPVTPKPVFTELKKPLMQQAGKLKSRWITKAEDSQMFIHSEFHHIIERPFLLQEADF